MPAKHFINEEAKLIVTEWEGDASDIDFIETIVSYQKKIQSDPKYLTYNEVANFTKIDSIKLTPKGLKIISEIASNTDQLKSNNKLALIVGSGTAFNLARIYASYRNLQKDKNKEIRIFKNEKDAIEWASTI